jgi:uncharacterized paraquat-inducible protein A
MNLTARKEGRAVRFKLNLNPYGTKMVAVIAIFLGVIPALLYIGSLLNILSDPAAQQMIKVSLVMGVFAAIVSIALILVEHIQDHALDEKYRRTRNKKLKMTADVYECQYCGNRKVRESDKCCQVCGKELK